MSNTRSKPLEHGKDSPKSRRKLGELIVYLASQCASDPKFGATKLNKVLFFADFECYRKHGKSLTGAEYQRENFGPIPKHLLTAKRELKGAIIDTEVQYGGMRQKRVMATRPADLSDFTAEEVACLESTIRALSELNATEVSDLSHGIAWKVARNGDPIPYQAAYISDRKPSQSDWFWAEQAIKAL